MNLPPNYLTKRAALISTIRSCRKCPNVTAPPVGFSNIPNHNRPYVLVYGEAPGPTEHIKAQPFVGRAGVFLRAELQRAQITNYVLTNTIQCYPGEIRKPTADEVTNCQTHAQSILSFINPTATLLLGSTAIQPYTTGKITDLHGNWFQHNNCWFFCTYHPSAVLRERQSRRLWDTFQDDLIRFHDGLYQLYICRRLDVPFEPEDQIQAGKVVKRRKKKLPNPDQGEMF